MTTSLNTHDINTPVRHLSGFPEMAVNEIERAYNKSGKPVAELLFLLKTGIVPSTKRYVSVKVGSAIEELCRHFEINRETVPVDELIFLSKEKSQQRGGMVFLKPDLLISGSDFADEVVVLFAPGKNEEELHVIDRIIRSNTGIKNGFHVLTAFRDQFMLGSCPLEDDKTDLGKYFNDDIQAADSVIRQKLIDPASRGLVLLHGEAGTGKSTYLKHLLATLDLKTVLIPADLVFGMHTPSFISFLNQHTDLTFVLEDIDDYITDGGGMGNTFVNNLVNFTDSLLSRHVSIRFICTFCLPVEKIARPLRRSGRILASFEFKPLTVDKCNRILNEIRPGCRTDHELPLADVFHYCESSPSRARSSRIGFSTAGMGGHTSLKPEH